MVKSKRDKKGKKSKYSTYIDLTNINVLVFSLQFFNFSFPYKN